MSLISLLLLFFRRWFSIQNSQLVYQKKLKVSSNQHLVSGHISHSGLDRLSNLSFDFNEQLHYTVPRENGLSSCQQHASAEFFSSQSMLENLHLTGHWAVRYSSCSLARQHNSRALSLFKDNKLVPWQINAWTQHCLLFICLENVHLFQSKCLLRQSA